MDRLDRLPRRPALSHLRPAHSRPLPPPEEWAKQRVATLVWLCRVLAAAELEAAARRCRPPMGGAAAGAANAGAKLTSLALELRGRAKRQ